MLVNLEVFILHERLLVFFMFCWEAVRLYVLFFILMSDQVQEVSISFVTGNYYQHVLGSLIRYSCLRLYGSDVVVLVVMLVPVFTIVP